MRKVIRAFGLVAAMALMVTACGSDGGVEETSTTAAPDAGGEPQIDMDAEVDTDANGVAFSTEVPGARLVMRDVAGSVDSFVGVGYESEGDTTLPSAAAAWRSDDGWNWERIEDDALDEPGDIAAVVATDDGFVAVGAGGRGVDSAAVWLSGDGRDWERIADHEELFAGGDMSDVAVGPDGLVAIGNMTIGDVDEYDFEVVAAVWASEDGREWERVPDADLPGGDGGGTGQSLNGVTASAEGFLAGGVEDGQAMVWRSVDGSSWDLVEPKGLAEGTSIRDVAASEDGYVAVGSTSSLLDAAEDAIWFSPDGDVWEQLDLDLDSGQLLFAVGVNEAGSFVAVGPEETDPDDAEDATKLSEVWASDDGRSWERLPFEDESDATGSMFGVEVFANGYIAVGFEDESAQVWIDQLGGA